MTKFRELLRRLTDAQVELVVIGGLAVISHGHARTTLAIDVCYARTPENLRRLVAALSPIHPGFAVLRPTFLFSGTNARCATG